MGDYHAPNGIGIAPGDSVAGLSIRESACFINSMQNETIRISEPLSVAADAETRWFALSVNVRHEKQVSQILVNKGFETFLPLYTKRHRYERRVREFDLPLFPGYVFCRVDPKVRLPVLTTPGVLRIVGAGRVPIPLEDHEIGSLRRAAQAGVPMFPHPFWRSGQMGRVVAGPLAGVEGIVVGTKHSMRLVISVSLLQRSVLLEIDADCVAAA